MSWSSWLCFEISVLFCLVRRGCFVGVILPGASPIHTSSQHQQSRSRTGVSSAESTPAVLPEQQRKSNDLRATTKEAQHRRNQQTIHLPLFTSLPPHNTAKMLLGMKKFPVKVRK
jgi:hypothetical protein